MRGRNLLMRTGFGLLLVAGSLLIATSGGNSPVMAHGIFKKTIETKYEGLRVTCYMCHVKKEEKTVRNEFGELFVVELKGQDLSARWNAVEGDERKALENDVMAPAILEALVKIEKKENGDGEKYGELIPAGKIEGSKLKKR